MYPLDSGDIQWIFTKCMYPLARLSIEYYLDVSIRLGGYPVDIYSVYMYPLAGLSIEYYLDVSIRLGRYPMDIHSV